MASIHKEIVIDGRPEHVWAAVRDFGAVHQRLARGFVTDTRLDGEARVVTFANGYVARELLVDMDDTARRIAYAGVPGRLTHYNASMQIFSEGAERTRLVWIADLLPNEMASVIRGMIEEGSKAIKATLEQSK
jgi:hypothetical protein